MLFSQSNVAWHTEVGRRKNNEDDCAVQIAGDGSACLLVVADGMGGHQSGEIASRTAVTSLVDAFNNTENFAPQDDFQSTLQSTILSAHNAIQSQSAREADKEGMGTTVVTALMRQDQVLIGHIGDSRALQFRDGNVRRLTRDHLFAVDVLDVDENKAKFHPQGNVLSQALGTGEIEPSINNFDLQEGDFVVLCTDGVSEYVSEPQMYQALLLPELSQAASQIVSLALQSGSRDNCTVVVARVSS